MRAIRPKGSIQKKSEVNEANRTLVYKSGSYGQDPQQGEPLDVAGLNLFFVGLRASGKSTLAKLVAKDTGRSLVDMDALVQEKAGTTIAQYVEEHGWEAFRELEHQVLGEVCQGKGQVVATGGGVVLRPDNRELLRASGKTFYLMAPLPTLLARLNKNLNADQRPPLSGKPLDEEMREALIQREPLYMEVADFILAGERPLEELTEDVSEKLEILR